MADPVRFSRYRMVDQSCSAVRSAQCFAQRFPARPGLALFTIAFLCAIWGCQGVQEVAKTQADPAASLSRGGDELLIVDCLLPGQIRKLGRSIVYLTPQRPIKTSAQDCEIRG